MTGINKLVRHIRGISERRCCGYREWFKSGAENIPKRRAVHAAYKHIYVTCVKWDLFHRKDALQWQCINRRLLHLQPLISSIGFSSMYTFFWRVQNVEQFGLSTCSFLQVYCYLRHSEPVVKGRAHENQNIVPIHTDVIQKPNESLQKNKTFMFVPNSSLKRQIFYWYGKITTSYSCTAFKVSSLFDAISTKCGRGHSYAPPSNSSSLWATKELDSSKNLIIHEPSREKILRNSNLMFQLRYFQKTLVFDLPPPIVGPVTQHTYIQIC